jgi:transcriptional antiterminator RfaH
LCRTDCIDFDVINREEELISMPILSKETSLFPETLFEEPDWDSERQWWVIFTKSRQEKALARDLLGSQIPFFLPLIPKDNLIRGRRVQSHIPLFGSYIFLFGSTDEQLQSLMTKRVTRILPVPDQEQLFCDLRNVHELIESGAPLTVERRLVPGQRVRIKSGPMKGVEGTITARRGTMRLLVAVHFLQNGVSMDIDDYMVEPIG